MYLQTRTDHFQEPPMIRSAVSLLLLVSVLASSPLAAQAPAPAVDIVGRWTAVFETQIGTQHYTYEFTRKDGVLAATATNDMGASAIADVKVDKGIVTFTETFKYMDMDISIQYKGTIAGPDEIRFTRDVMGFANEDLVAKRVKN
jgi:hypothetical protein